MKENTKNFLLISSAAIPYIGGPISVLIDKTIPSELQKRKNNLIEQFDKDIEEIKYKIRPERLESEEYLTIFFKIFKNAIEEHEENKIKKFRAILKKSATIEFIENPEIEYYIQLVSQLSNYHFIIFDLINNKQFNENVHYMISNKAVQNACVSDLIKLNLLKEEKILNRTEYKLSKLGNSFYKFIEIE